MDQLRVGTVLRSPGDFDRLPIGTVITPNNNVNQEYVKRVDGWYYDDRHYPVSDFSMGYNTVKSIPRGKSVTWESLAQWQYRFRDNAFVAAESAGVSPSTVVEAMNELGIGDDYFPLGRGVMIGSQHDKERLPVGAQIAVGQPQTITAFGLFVKSRNGWVHLLGDVNRPDGHRTLVVSGPEAAWAVTPGTEAEQQELANFKARAWRVGWRVKLAHRWCESYEQYMGRIGLTEDALQGTTHGGIAVGERVGTALANVLPAGSVLRWQHNTDPQTWTWYIRDDDATNRSRTRALFGHRRDGAPLRNSGASMEVMWIASDEDAMSVRVDNLEAIWESIPPGTLLDVSGTAYVVASDHLVNGVSASGVVPATGTWRLDQLGDNVRITRFGS